MKKMLTIDYRLKDGKKWAWAYKKLDVAIEVIKDDFKECPEIVKAVVFDEDNKKILELKNEPVRLIGGKEK